MKQGFLYLQQQQTFGKVGGARMACKEFPGRRGVWQMSPNPCGMVDTVPSTKADPELNLGGVLLHSCLFPQAGPTLHSLLTLLPHPLGRGR